MLDIDPIPKINLTPKKISPFNAISETTIIVVVKNFFVI
jgi:hypothetical protein